MKLLKIVEQHNNKSNFASNKHGIMEGIAPPKEETDQENVVVMPKKMQQKKAAVALDFSEPASDGSEGNLQERFKMFRRERRAQVVWSPHAAAATLADVSHMRLSTHTHTACLSPRQAREEQRREARTQVDRKDPAAMKVGCPSPLPTRRTPRTLHQPLLLCRRCERSG